MDNGWEACRREDDLVFVSDPNNARAADGSTRRPHNRIDEQIRDVIAVCYARSKPKAWRGPKRCQQRSRRIIIAGLESSGKPRRSAEPWYSVACRKPRREHDKVTKTETLLGHPACQISFQFAEPSRRPSFDALVERDLCTMAIEVADNADQLCRALQSQQPLQHGRTPASVPLTGRRSAGPLEHEESAGATRIEPDDTRIGTAH
jgi:hypothetical protein